jgi:hypothetical protein
LRRVRQKERKREVHFIDTNMKTRQRQASPGGTRGAWAVRGTSPRTPRGSGRRESTTSSWTRCQPKGEGPAANGSNVIPRPLGPLGLGRAQHRRTSRPSVERVRRKALLLSDHSTKTSRPYMGTSRIRNRLPQDPTVGLCLGPYCGPRGGTVSSERGTPVQ